MAKSEANFVRVYKNAAGELTDSRYAWEVGEDGKPKMVDNTPVLTKKGKQVLSPVNRKARRASKSNKMKGF